MYQLTAVYAHPQDPDSFVTHYRDTHAEIARALPDVQYYNWHVCETLDGTRPPYFLAAVIQWESKEHALASLDSEEGKRAVADLANFAQAGCEMQFGDVTVEVPRPRD
ncbi:putative ethyl tert-butyl ether degradation protein EthD [Actinomycetospora sp. NBRC 106375]|uniref:EthD family reductase n=1 Tax=Actinomycetospora sp. NBRC 106375 TaxID=3032207 RepID=UPI0024A137CA|nr:EthD family reductase [Actinomycetospora sp. NBRC 106375]GLZ50276.1 putative ethyl tert-butyl ether degradation protein EthD [Actinomycetospora sp. NBRC 106375]